MLSYLLKYITTCLGKCMQCLRGFEIPVQGLPVARFSWSPEHGGIKHDIPSLTLCNLIATQCIFPSRQWSVWSNFKFVLLLKGLLNIFEHFIYVFIIIIFLHPCITAWPVRWLVLLCPCPGISSGTKVARLNSQNKEVKHRDDSCAKLPSPAEEELQPKKHPLISRHLFTFKNIHLTDEYSTRPKTQTLKKCAYALLYLLAQPFLCHYLVCIKPTQNKGDMSNAILAHSPIYTLPVQQAQTTVHVNVLHFHDHPCAWI